MDKATNLFYTNIYCICIRRVITVYSSMNRTHLSKFQIDMFQEDLPQHLVSAKSIVQGVKSAGSSCNWKLLRTRNYIFIYIYYVILNKYIQICQERERGRERRCYWPADLHGKSKCRMRVFPRGCTILWSRGVAWRRFE